MKNIYAILACALASAPSLFGQAATIDWPYSGGDAQRSGWEKTDWAINKTNVKDFRLVMKMNLDPSVKGDHSLSAPAVLGRIISYRGFKELALLQSASGKTWAIDADMNRIFWEKSFERPKGLPKSGGPNAAMCDTSVVSATSLTPPVAFGGGRGRGGPPGGAPGTSPGAAPPPVRPAAPPNAARSLLSGGGFGGPRPAFGVSADGKLHLMNTSTGEDVGPVRAFLPPGAKAGTLLVADNTVYANTLWGCGGSINAVYALDLSGEEPKLSHFNASAGGIAIGADGTVYAQTVDSITSLAAKTLDPKQTAKAPRGFAEAAPVLFTYQEKEMMVAAGKSGELYVIDPKTMTVLSETTAADKVSGGLSSWQDTDGTRYVVAPVSGPHGSVVSYKLDASGPKPTLSQAWTSHELDNPETPVITSGMVFALASGHSSGHATLYAFDGVTGAQLYYTGDQVTSPANLTGLTVANGRVFFTTTDGTLYGFGIYMER